MRQSMTAKERYIKRKVKPPNKLIAWLAFAVLGILCRQRRTRFTYDYDKADIKGKPVLFLSAHTARDEFVYSLYGFGRRDINLVCGFQNIFKKGLETLSRLLGFIPKYLYQPDGSSVFKMLRVLRRGGCLGLFPEGIQSVSGSMQPINPATADLIQFAGVTVVLCTGEGSYLAKPRFTKDRKRGAVHMHYTLLFTPEELASLTKEQIYEKLLSAFRYNEYEANRKNRTRFVGKKPNADGLCHILYRCPVCHAEFTLESQGEHFTCSQCGLDLTVNAYYDLVPSVGTLPFADIDAWYKWQRRVLREEIRRGGYMVEAKGQLFRQRTDILCRPPHDRLPVAEGKILLSSDGLTVTDAGGSEFRFSARQLYSLNLAVGRFLEFYYENDYYILIPDCPKKQYIKWMLASEELHFQVDPKWNKVACDAYGYDTVDETNEKKAVEAHAGK